MEFDEYTKTLMEFVKSYEGFVNAHTHLDRANTLDKRYLEHVSMDPIEASSYPLKVKQNLVGDLHRGIAYQTSDLEKRMRRVLEDMIEVGTREVVSFIDTTADNIGLSAFELALKLKGEYKDKITLKLAAYPVFGFKVDEPERWKIYKEAVEKADIVGGLPERDDKKEHPRSIGFDEHIRKILVLGKELKKEVHFHLDQRNSPEENGTETLIEAVRWLGQPIERKEPSVWAIHVISPSCYYEERFRKLLEGLKKYNIGIICCPKAAISMKQLRNINTPTHNSIARVLEMLVEGIEIRIGSDNIADVFVPSGTPNMYQEIGVLSDALRFYNPDILAKLACAKPLTDMDRELIRRALEIS